MSPRFPVDDPERKVAYAPRTFVRIKDGKKLCPKCQQVLPLSEFHQGTGRHKVKSYCKKCAIKRTMDYRRTLPEGVHRLRARNGQLKFHFGLTLESLAEMFKQQDSKCAICRDPLDFATYGKTWVVDHDHKSHPETRWPVKARPRGLLCFKCNTALGNFRDNPAILTSAIKYLEANK